MEGLAPFNIKPVLVHSLMDVVFMFYCYLHLIFNLPIIVTYEYHLILGLPILPYVVDICLLLKALRRDHEDVCSFCFE